jgi:hypothetical protein
VTSTLTTTITSNLTRANLSYSVLHFVDLYLLFHSLQQNHWLFTAILKTSHQKTPILTIQATGTMSIPAQDAGALQHQMYGTLHAGKATQPSGIFIRFRKGSFPRSKQMESKLPIQVGTKRQLEVNTNMENQEHAVSDIQS